MNSGARPSKATSSDVVSVQVAIFCASDLNMAEQVLWSGCKDSQTSADTRVEGRATGAMSYVRVQDSSLPLRRVS